MTPSAKVYSDLLEALYAATLDESQWQAFLARLCDVTGSVIAFLIRNDRAIGRCVLASSCAPLTEMTLSYTTVDPVREAFMRRPRVGIVEVEDFLPHARLLQSDYHRVHMAPQRAIYGTCIVPTLSLRRYDLIALWRSTHPRLEPQHAELLALLFPHIQNAIRIHATLGIAQQRAQITEAILDTSAAASLLVDASGHLLYMNEAARQLVAAGDGLRDQNGRLTASLPHLRPELARLIADAVGMKPHPGGAIMLERTGNKRPLQVLVTQLRTDGPRRRRQVLLLATDPDRVPRFPDTVLRDLYSLTPAETEIANGLLTGYPLEAIAAIRGVSVGTVRTQVKSLLLKTGTQRQVDLVRLLYAFPLPQPPAV